MSYNSMVVEQSYSTDLAESRDRTYTQEFADTALYEKSLSKTSSPMNEYQILQRSALKRKEESPEFGVSAKMRSVAGSYNPTVSSHATTYPGRERTVNKESKSPLPNKPISGKKKKIDLTLDWLEENYTICDGVCLARCVLYSHYKDFCNKNGIEPACAATFGKTIRQKFPRVTTRRLGTRGHSKYHYYGIGIRETSIYYHSVFAGKGLTRYSPKLKADDDSYLLPKSQPTLDRSRHFLDEIPNFFQFNSETECDLSLEKKNAFLNYYKGTCKKILEAARIMDFNLLSTSLIQLWSNLPFQQFPAVQQIDIIMDLVMLCDVTLYDELIDILLPLPCDQIDERQLVNIGNLGKQWDEFLKTSLLASSNSLIEKRKALAQQLSQTLMRHVSFIKLNRTVHAIFSNVVTFLPMRNDMEKISLQHSIGSQALYGSNEDSKDSEFNNELLKELTDLLRKNATVEMFVEWLDSVIDSKVIKPSKQNGRSLKKRAQDFLLKWSFFGARITHNLNNTNASSFNSFHYLRMFLVEYAVLAIETQFSNEKHQEIKRAVAKHAKNQKLSNSAAASNRSASKSGLGADTEKSELKCEPQEAVSKKWDPFNCWSSSGAHEVYTKSEFQTDAVFSPTYYNDLQNTLYSHSTQSYTNCNSIAYHPLSYEEQQSGNSHSQKRETVVYENGTSFTYLTGPPHAKSESYLNYHPHSVSCEPDFSPGSVCSRESSSCHYEASPSSATHGSFSCLGTSDFFNQSQSSSFLKTPNYFTRAEQTPVNRSDSDPQFCFSNKNREASFRENICSIQDLSYTNNEHNQNSATLKEHTADAQKMNYKAQHGYRLLDDSSSSIPASFHSFTSYMYGEAICDSSEANVSSTHNYKDDENLWNTPVMYAGSPHTSITSTGHHPTLFQENLPSISSVLNAE